jgi:peptidylprolyl isomerase
MCRVGRFIPVVCGCLFVRALVCHGGVDATRGYAPLGQPVQVGVTGVSSGETWLALMSPDSDLEITRAPVGPGCVDLLEVFPLLRDTPPARAVEVQAFEGGKPDGPALVLVPMWTPARPETALTSLVRSGLRQRSTEALDRLIRTAPGSIPALDRQMIEEPRGENERVFTGYRVLQDRRVRVRTSLGDLEFALRHDAAPNAAAAFLRLVDGGFYDGTPIHRLVTIGPSARPVLAQMGDPTGTGFGGAGERIGYEASTLKQRRGVLSLARVPGDPDSASSQFIIALSDEEAGVLEGAATPIGELTLGSAVLDDLAAVPVGPRDPEVPGSPKDRPLATLKIERAWTVDAPPRGAVEEVAVPAKVEPVER